MDIFYKKYLKYKMMDSLKIKPIHHFTNIKKYILSKDELKDNYNRFLQLLKFTKITC